LELGSFQLQVGVEKEILRAADNRPERELRVENWVLWLLTELG
jgi:hypothetical protein